MLEPGKKLAVFSIRAGKFGTIWVRAGNANINKDGSMNIYLDVLPMDGRLHVREAGEKKDAAPSETRYENAAPQAAATMEGH